MIADACISGALIKSLYLLSHRCELVPFEMLLVSTFKMIFRFSVISYTTPPYGDESVSNDDPISRNECFFHFFMSGIIRRI